jgi:hypothetical protein
MHVKLFPLSTIPLAIVCCYRCPQQVPSIDPAELANACPTGSFPDYRSNINNHCNSLPNDTLVFENQQVSGFCRSGDSSHFLCKPVNCKCGIHTITKTEVSCYECYECAPNQLSLDNSCVDETLGTYAICVRSHAAIASNATLQRAATDIARTVASAADAESALEKEFVSDAAALDTIKRCYALATGQTKTVAPPTTAAAAQSAIPDQLIDLPGATPITATTCSKGDDSLPDGQCSVGCWDK